MQYTVSYAAAIKLTTKPINCLFDAATTYIKLMHPLFSQSKEKERRIRMREQKLEEQRLHQEERMKRALERAQSDAKKNVSKQNKSIVHPALMHACTIIVQNNLL